MPPDPVSMMVLLGGARVILSTIGMLSNPTLEKNRTFDLVPVERLVVDEASQINSFEYLVSLRSIVVLSIFSPSF